MRRKTAASRSSTSPKEIRPRADRGRTVSVRSDGQDPLLSISVAFIPERDQLSRLSRLLPTVDSGGRPGLIMQIA
jgi:hypothetical protein